MFTHPGQPGQRQRQPAQLALQTALRCLPGEPLNCMVRYNGSTCSDMLVSSSQASSSGSLRSSYSKQPSVAFLASRLLVALAIRPCDRQPKNCSEQGYALADRRRRGHQDRRCRLGPFRSLRSCHPRGHLCRLPSAGPSLHLRPQCPCLLLSANAYPLHCKKLAKGTAPSDILACWSSQASGSGGLRSSHFKQPSVAFLVSSLSTMNVACSEQPS